MINLDHKLSLSRSFVHRVPTTWKVLEYQEILKVMENVRESPEVLSIYATHIVILGLNTNRKQGSNNLGNWEILECQGI